MSKRYYWLKLKEDFFTSKRIKKLRSMAGGDTYTIIYLKMQLLAMKTGGVLEWSGLEDNFAEELALDLDENPNNVEITLMYLLKTGLAETQDMQTFIFPYVVENTGSEGDSAQRMRDLRMRINAQSDAIPSQCDSDVTQRKRKIKSKSKNISSSDKSSEDICPELLENTSAPEANVEALLLNDGSEWRPSLSEYEEWKRLFPATDINDEFRNMRVWCMKNPTKRKTKRGVRRFVLNWLTNAQDKPHQTGTTAKAQRLEKLPF